ncbi:hypothetical protein B0T17DRAFT_524718 [Bombardia bombarda]|uniref:Secreted protein n=1 Tax=Bombardia bombarda TaxID=252184 RepID=A0AA40C9F6_9PEZI|nr:hypothetical protein B0T17DRAFT_524718 [Bombardia bombarda]
MLICAAIVLILEMIVSWQSLCSVSDYVGQPKCVCVCLCLLDRRISGQEKRQYIRKPRFARRSSVKASLLFFGLLKRMFDGFWFKRCLGTYRSFVRCCQPLWFVVNLSS